MQTLNCKGRLIDLSVPKVMGIINVTPDSFYDGGKTTSRDNILVQAEQMLSDGATFLDIGGYSSRPGAEDISETKELERIQPAIEAILKKFPEAVLSIDTYRSKVAKKAVEAGAAIVNDISGGVLDSEMIPTVATLKVPYILMHIRGTPQDMTQHTNYKNVVTEVLNYFSERIAVARKAGINDIVVDPGFGFAKTRSQSFELLNHLELFQQLNTPILAGLSRKSLIYKTLETTATNALNGTTVLNSIALYKGVSLLRVHDVKEANECIALLQNLKNEA
ncbi:dihydropteroate synthase [Ulvibacter sp. MAR_2010_11]|uniref:dihydropteroate synthase n=1 Tax=Ulvibacter sp. MAR_2010_11 TaxID=1250229 RepID=UPI000CBDF1F3|nr:dihydropteroate synthase [Ulvibacter sp. MAR_2010_11]PKA82233.1 dihydropteroate synthase [Ulvibacter sp. MAR_2010_11]